MKKNLSFLSLILTLFLVACGEENSDIQEGTNADTDTLNEELQLDEFDDQTLMIGLTNSPDGFNPLYAPGMTFFHRFIYDSLLVMPEPDQFESALAISFETDDNETFTINLDPDAYWTDGEPVTSEDVVWTLNAIAHPDIQSSRNSYLTILEGTDHAGYLEEGLDELPGLEIIDDHTLTFTTKYPVDQDLVHLFIGYEIFIAPAHIFGELELNEIQTSDHSTNPTVTSGPYLFETYDEDNYVHLTANKNYYRGEPKIETIYGRILNGSLMATEFQANNLHMTAGGGIGVVPHQDIPMLENIEGLVVEEYPSNVVQYLLINHEVFDNPDIRLALTHAINRELIVDNLLEGRGEILSTPYTSLHHYHHEDIDPHPYDPELASELLEEANFDFDRQYEFVVPTGNSIREQAGDLIHQWLTDIGVDVNLVNIDFPTWLEQANSGDYDFGLMGRGLGVDPNSSNYFTGNNTENISDPIIDDLLELGLQATSFEERYPIYAELQEYIHDNAIMIPIYSESQYSIQVENLTGGIRGNRGSDYYDIHEWSLD